LLPKKQRAQDFLEEPEDWTTDEEEEEEEEDVPKVQEGPQKVSIRCSSCSQPTVVTMPDGISCLKPNYDLRDVIERQTLGVLVHV
jgi:hypothetical protein